MYLLWIFHLVYCITAIIKRTLSEEVGRMASEVGRILGRVWQASNFPVSTNTDSTA